jgi:hypothetical protein
MMIFVCVMALLALGKGKQVPVVSENFQCNSQEVANNETVVRQFLAFDTDVRRSNMEAAGSLVHGGMQQIKRCDLMPNEGWYTSAGGPNPKDASTWMCTNTTIPRYGELPYYCEYGTFWSFPPMKYVGEDEVNGVPCDYWEYFMSEDTYGFWATTDADGSGIPLASGRVASPNPSASLYTIFFTNFVGTNPPEESYAAVDGCNCPESTDVVWDDSLREEEEKEEAAWRPVSVHSLARTV